MEPGDFISSIYLYVSLVLVSGNCIFNPLNRFNPLSSNFFLFYFWSHVCFCYTTAVLLSFPAKKTRKTKGILEKLWPGKCIENNAKLHLSSPFSSSSFFEESSR